MIKKQKKVSLLTHLSYDDSGMPFIGLPIPISVTGCPNGRMSGVFGRPGGLKATTYWWGKVKSKYKRPLSKVELFLDDNGEISVNQGIEDIGNLEILNIVLGKLSLTDQLSEWTGGFDSSPTMHLGDRDIFRKISKDPEIINQLFDMPRLSHVKAIVWPASDPENNQGYVKMITVRSMDDITGVRIYNFEGDHEDVPYSI